MVTRVALGTFFMVATLMIVSFTAIDEPARMAQFESGYEGRSVEAGAALYANNCATCHGPDGKGIAGRAPALNAAGLFVSLEAGCAYLIVCRYAITSARSCAAICSP